MAIYYPAGAFTDEHLSKPIIFEQHYSGVASATSAQDGFPSATAANELTYERWRPLTLPASWSVAFTGTYSINYMAIAAHTLAGKRLDIARRLGGNWFNVHSVNVQDNRPIIVIFPPVPAEAMGFTILANTSASIPSIGVVFFGTYLSMPNSIEVGISPISLSRKTIYSGNTSEGGNWLGRSVKRTGKAGQIPLKMMPRNWYQSTLDPALQRMRYKPFFFASCPKLMPWDASYCWLTDDPKPVTVGGMLMDVTLNVEAHAHE